jgi:aryl-alcohol dehydrogenase-like predicted oxidoreductase
VKLALGTVQFGLDYGIANTEGRVSFDETSTIVRHARAGGIDVLDTAMAYGDSEARLGQVGVGKWRIVSKLPPIPEDCVDVSRWAETAVGESLERLGVRRLFGLLLHRPEQLLGPDGPRLYAALQGLREQGVVEKVGVSVYGPDELDALFACYRFDLVQAPFNLLDRRLVTSGWLSRLASQEVELHVRSVFLQGLLLMSRGGRPAAFDRWAPLWKALDLWLEGAGMTPLQACLRDALSFPEIGKVVIGVDSLSQLEDILRAAEGPATRPPEVLGTADSDLLNPSCWSA